MQNRNAHLFEQLLRLVPLGDLEPVSLSHLAACTALYDVAPGRRLFQRGDDIDQVFYLLSGRVALRAAGRETVIEAGTPAARHPLSNLNPREFTATTLGAVTIARLPAATLDAMVVWDQLARSGADSGGGIAALRGEADSAWLGQMLHNGIYLQLPTAYTDTLLRRFVPVSAKAGQVVLRQGETGDYYYVIKDGCARVSRRLRLSENEVEIARLRSGDGFGIEAILSGAPRSATVTLVTDAVLLRLSRGDFRSLLQAPSVSAVSEPEAVSLRNNGAVLLDVRFPDEYRRATIKGSINLPLLELRARSHQLDRNRRYVLFCDSGTRSMAAAYLLRERGVDARVLEGGLQTVNRRVQGVAEQVPVYGVSRAATGFVS